MPLRYFFLMLLLLAPLAVQAQGSGLAFLKLGTHAAALGAGSAQTASTADAFSTYWNPAGLAQAPGNSAGLTYNAWVGDIQIYSLAARLGTGPQAGWGVSVTAVSSGELEARLGPGDPDGVFNAQFISAGLSYGRAFGALRLGATAKFLSERIFTVSSNGYAFDAGAQVSLREGFLQAGVVLQHLGDMNELQLESTALPRTLRAGVSVRPLRIANQDDDSPLLKTVLNLDVSRFLVTDETQVHIGATGEILETINIRAGLLTNDGLQRFTFGLGFLFDEFRFDYAYLPFQDGFGDAGQILSIMYLW